MMKKLTCWLLAVFMAFNLVACNTASEDSSKATATTNQEEAATRIFTDDCGREVEIPETITSYVASGPLAQIILYAIAPDEMAGLATKWYDSAKRIISEEHFNLPYIGQLYGSADMNVEELAKVGPQVIIDIGEKKESIEDDLNTLEEQTDIPAVYVSSTTETMPQTFRTLGKLLGKEEKGEELAQFCEKVYTRTCSIMDEVGENKQKGIFVVGEEGLNVLAATSFQAEVFDFLVDKIAVVENPLGKGTGNEVTMEQIALWNPDFVLFGPQSIYSTVKEDDAWSEINAIMTSNYIEVPEGPHNWMGSPPSVQQYLGLIWLTAQLYPEYCDYDVKADIMEYYELFYHCELTEDQYNTLTANAFLQK